MVSRDRRDLQVQMDRKARMVIKELRDRKAKKEKVDLRDHPAKEVQQGLKDRKVWWDPQVFLVILESLA